MVIIPYTLKKIPTLTRQLFKLKGKSPKKEIKI